MEVPEPRKLPSGKWFIQLRLGGQSISVSDYNKKECVTRAQFIKAEYLTGKRQAAEEPTPATPTLCQAINNCISERTNTLSPATIRGYRIIQRNRFQDEMPRKLAVVPDENNKRVKKQQNKNTTSTRNVPVMIPELATVLERDRKPFGSVMPHGQGSLRRVIRKVCEENSLPDVGIHGLRHSFASLAYHLQIPEKIAMEIGGWADATTMHRIYTHIAKSDIKRYQTAMTKFYADAEPVDE